MIFDAIRNKENYKAETKIYQALCYLEQISRWDEILPDTVILEDCMFAGPVSFIRRKRKNVYMKHIKNTWISTILWKERKESQRRTCAA